MDIFHDSAAVGLGKLHVGKVPDCLNTAGGEPLGHGDSHILGHGKHCHVYRIVGNIVLKLVYAADGNAVELRPDQLGLHVERAREIEAPFTEAEIIHKCTADVADTDQYGAEAPVHAHDGGDLCAQSGHIIAVTLLAEFTEAAEVLPDLGRGQAELLAQIERRYTADAVLGQLVQLAKIPGQPPDNIVGNFDTLHLKISPYILRAPNSGIPLFISIINYITSMYRFQGKKCDITVI